MANKIDPLKIAPGPLGQVAPALTPDNVNIAPPDWNNVDMNVYKPQLDTQIQRPAEAPTTPLSDALSKDLLASSQAFQKAQAGIGVNAPQVQQTFRERGIRLGDRVVANQEFRNSLRAQDDTVNQLVKTAGFKDQVVANKFQASLNDRLNRVRQELLRRGLELDRRLNEAKVSAEERAKARALFGKIAGAIVGGVVAGPAGAGVGAGAGGDIMGGGGAGTDLQLQQRNTAPLQADFNPNLHNPQSQQGSVIVPSTEPQPGY